VLILALRALWRLTCLERLLLGRRRRGRIIIYEIAVILAIFTVVFTLYAAAEAASSIRNGEKPTVEVRYRLFSGSAGQVTVPGLQLIGATQGRFLL
jgi:hypothetical protein